LEFNPLAPWMLWFQAAEMWRSLSKSLDTRRQTQGPTSGGLGGPCHTLTWLNRVVRRRFWTSNGSSFRLTPELKRTERVPIQTEAYRGWLE
jgi:hypothetical protein